MKTVGTIENRPNRATRRRNDAFDRRRPYRAKVARIQENFEEGRRLHREAVAKKQELAHAKAVLRKENAKPTSQTKKDLKEAQALVKKQQAKKLKQTNWLKKHAK